MSSRLLRTLVLAWLSLWFGVIVPGHRRGAVVMPGSGVSVTAAGCCARVPTPARGAQSGKRTDRPDPVRAENCAVCYIVARLDTPTTVHFQAILLGLLGIEPPPAVRNLAGLDCTVVARGRDPPHIATA